MALSKEKLVSNNQSTSFNSEPIEQSSTTDPQLEALLDLLVDLHIIQPNNPPKPEPSLSNQELDHSVAILEELQNLILSPSVENSEESSLAANPNLDIAETSNVLPQSQEKSIEPLLIPEVADKPLEIKKEDTEASNILDQTDAAQEQKLPISQIDANNLENKSAQANSFSFKEKIQQEAKKNPPNILTDKKKLSSSLTALQALLITPEKPQESLEIPLLSKSKAENSVNTFNPLAEKLTEAELSHLQEFFAQEQPLLPKATVEISTNGFNSLQQSLSEPELSHLQELIANLEKKLASLENQVYQPTDLINPLLPLITELFHLKVAESREEVFSYIVPLIDEIIQRRTLQDKQAMSTALATIIPTAIAQQINDSPEEIAKAIAPEIGAAIQEQIRLERDSISNALAPEMGRAIKAQIELERDAMVDALYPVIGDTISKYMAEAVRSINEKVETTLSPEGIQRKIRAKLQGVSEAELILKDAMPFSIQAAFLIQKTSGLVISQVQQAEGQGLDADMLAGMLTAIRSFANECISQSGDISELNEIDYGNSKLILEVAGYCYLAVVVKGQPTLQFIHQMRKTLITIIQNYGQAMETFEGDPDTVPDPVNQLLKGLTVSVSSKKKKENSSNSPPILVKIGVGLLFVIGLPWGIYQYQNGVDRRIEAEAASALYSAPELSVYRLTPKVHQGTLKLTGRVPNEYLRSKAEQIAKVAAPTQKLENAIIAVDVPPDPILTAAEVERVQSLLNQKDGVAITGSYKAGKVNLEGTVVEVADAEKIPQAFEQIPGVRSVVSTIQLQPQMFTTRIYFDSGSTQLKSIHISQIIAIKRFLNQYPETHLRVIGHSNNVGNLVKNQELALQRAIAVKKTLQAEGIAPKRLQVSGTTKLPPKVTPDQPLELSRCVRFEVFIPFARSK